MGAERQERPLNYVRSGGVGEEADQFRARAKQCRSLARDARDGESRRTLDRMAEELDAEAEVIESEEDREPKRP
jgi:hypothetical protein